MSAARRAVVRDAATRRRSVYADPRWSLLREIVITRARGRCERCGASGVRLDVDHEIPVARDPSRAFDRRNLRAVCQPCHRMTDADRQRGYSTEAGPDGWPADPLHPSRRRDVLDSPP